MNQAFEIFIKARNKIKIEKEILNLLAELSTQYILVSVTNGNCDASQLSIASLFEKHYSPASGYRSKPNPQMLDQVIQDFNLEPSQVLHIGDRDDSDGLAAKQANCHYYHFAPFVGGKLNKAMCKKLVQDIK